jgi:hypothetical protein
MPAAGRGKAKGRSPIGPQPGWCEVRADIGRGESIDADPLWLYTPDPNNHETECC